MGISQILRPLSIGEILDRTFRLYRNHFFLLISIAGLALVPIYILQVLSQILVRDIQIAGFVQNGLNLVQNGLVFCLVQGSLAQAISWAYLSEPFSIRTAYQAGLNRYGSLWGTFFLQGLAIGAPVALVGCLVIAMAGTGGGVLILLLLIVPYAAYLGTRWLAAIPGVMLENLGATEGLRRSWNLTSNVFWRVFGISALANLLTFIIAQLPGMAVMYALTLFFPDATIGSVIGLLTTAFSVILALPFSMGVIVLLYYDLRVRREGYDLELQAQELAADPSGQV